jgi:hypothetical protein
MRGQLLERKIKMRILIVATAMAVALLAGCGENPPKNPPIGATVRYGFLSDSVLQLYNSSHEMKRIQITFKGKNGDSVTKSFTINPISQLEIGALECPWNFEAGETAVVDVEGYGKALHVKLSEDGKQYETYYR